MRAPKCMASYGVCSMASQLPQSVFSDGDGGGIRREVPP